MYQVTQFSNMHINPQWKHWWPLTILMLCTELTEDRHVNTTQLSVTAYTEHTYSVSQKSSPPPLKLFVVLTLLVKPV